MMTKRAEILVPSWPLYSFCEAARAQTTSRGSAVARSTLEELKLASPKSLEDIFRNIYFLLFLISGCGGWEKLWMRMWMWKKRIMVGVYEHEPRRGKARLD